MKPAPTVMPLDREQFAYLLLEVNGALPAYSMLPAQYQSWWEMAACLVPLVYDAAILPFPEAGSPRAKHEDITVLTHQQLTNERRLLNLRLSIQSFREWASGSASPGPWLTERYQRLTEALRAHT